MLVEMKLKMVVVALVLGGCSPVMNVGDGGDASVTGDVPSSRDVADDVTRDPMLIGTWEWSEANIPVGSEGARLALNADGTGRIDYVAFSNMCPNVRTASRNFQWRNMSSQTLRIEWGTACQGMITDPDGGLPTDGGGCNVPCNFFQMMTVRIADYQFDINGRLTLHLDGEAIRPYTRIR